MKLVQLSMEDTDALVKLSATLGWDYSPQDLRTIFASGIAYGHKTADGKLVSSAAIFPYERQLASLGMVMVDPDYRRQGLGQAVTKRVLNSLPCSTMPVILVATVQGFPLYEKLGFRTVATVHKWIAPQYRRIEIANLSGYRIKPLTAHDFPEVVRLDAEAFGAERNIFLQARFKQAQAGVLLLAEDGTAVGYALAIPGSVVTVLGPVVAPSAELALALIDELARRSKGALRIDVPSEQAELIERLPAGGFKLQSTPPVMLGNADQLPPRNGTLFGIAAQAFG
jgi:predicted N-acetyltransferase YhbS